jgi:hypothetical protein
MNGISASSKIVTLTPWWDTLLNSLMIASGVIAGLSLAMSFIIVLIPKKKKE